MRRERAEGRRRQTDDELEEAGSAVSGADAGRAGPPFCVTALGGWADGAAICVAKALNCGIVELVPNGWPVFCTGKGFVLGGCC